MNCCANLSNLVIYRALLSDPIVNALRRPKEFFAPELEGLLLVAAEEKGLTGLFLWSICCRQSCMSRMCFLLLPKKMTVKLVKDWQELQRMIL